MFRAALALAVLSIIAPTALADERSNQAPSPAELLAKQDDDKAITAFWNHQSRQISATWRDERDKVVLLIDETETALRALTPSEEKAREVVTAYLATIGHFRNQLDVHRTPLEVIEQELLDNPDAIGPRGRWYFKLHLSIPPLALAEPTKAAELMERAKAFGKNWQAKASDKETKQVIATIFEPLGDVGKWQQLVDAGFKMASLIGKPAPPLQVEAWLNGSPLRDEDLKGKVVVLDFWAVWCEPCIDGFADLKRWYEEYADRGLIIIGATQYYNFQWNAEERRPAPAKGEVAPEVESQMLKRFVDQHELKHRIAIEREKAISDAFAVTALPQLVVIDRAGKIQMVRVMGGAKDVAAVDQLLAELIGKE